MKSSGLRAPQLEVGGLGGKLQCSSEEIVSATLKVAGDSPFGATGKEIEVRFDRTKYLVRIPSHSA